jgi:hypothetical protein
MDEAWYIVEQQIRERHAEVREAARIRALTQDLATTARRPNSVRITLSRLAKWVLGSSNALPSEAFTHAGHRPTGDEPLRVVGRERTPPCAKGTPECGSGRRRKTDSRPANVAGCNT